MNASPKFRLTPLAALLGLMALSGCATKEFVQQEVSAVDSRVSSRIDSLQNLLNAASLRIASNDTKIKGAEERLGKAELGATQLGQRIDSNLDGLNKANARIDGLAGDMAAPCAASRDCGDSPGRRACTPRSSRHRSRRRSRSSWRTRRS